MSKAGFASCGTYVLFCFGFFSLILVCCKHGMFWIWLYYYQKWARNANFVSYHALKMSTYIRIMSTNTRRLIPDTIQYIFSPPLEYEFDVWEKYSHRQNTNSGQIKMVTFKMSRHQRIESVCQYFHANRLRDFPYTKANDFRCECRFLKLFTFLSMANKVNTCVRTPKAFISLCWFYCIEIIKHLSGIVACVCRWKWSNRK